MDTVGSWQESYHDPCGILEQILTRLNVIL